jgi:hypothetical protein
MLRRVRRRDLGVLIVEDEPYMAEAIRDDLRLEAMAADRGDRRTAKSSAPYPDAARASDQLRAAYEASLACKTSSEALAT